MTRAERNPLAAIAFAATLISVRIVNAQESDEAALVLAQAFVAEAGFDAPQDHAAIAHVLGRNAERIGIPLTDYAIRYVSLLRVNADGRHVVQSERAFWVRGLALDAHRPDGWPANLSWAAHVDRWLATVERARAYLRGELADPCAREAPQHWGARTGRDMERATRAGWVLARCSAGTRNAVWRVER